MAQLPPQTPEQAEAIALRDKEHKEFYNDRVQLDAKGKPIEVEALEYEMDAFGNYAVDKQNRKILKKFKRKLLEDMTTEVSENIVGVDGKVERKVTKVTGYKILLND